jgi:ribonuclease-3
MASPAEYSPYNPKNVPVTVQDIEHILHEHGLAGYTIKNLALFQKAMVHTSYVRRSEYTTLTGEIASLAPCPTGVMDLQTESYEQLEFRGDSILGASVASYLCDRYYDESPGFLTNARKLIVRNKTLGRVAKILGLDKFFVISKHVEDMKSEFGRQNPEKLGDVLEAFLAALWVDSCYDFKSFHSFVVTLIETHLDIPTLLREDDNYKDRMQKHCQQVFKYTPIYNMLKNEDGYFTMAVCDTNNTILGIGKATTKKQAEQYACKAALEKLKVV